jgi:phage-related minor tail protein
MADDTSGFSGAGAVTIDPELAGKIEDLHLQMSRLTISANSFAGAMSRAFSQSLIGGRQLDDVLKQLVLRLSDLTLKAAFQPLATGIVSGLGDLFGGLMGAGGGGMRAALGAVKPFAAGGVIASPTYFPLQSGGLGLAGEAGPEAIMPLSRGPDGRLGVAASGGAAPNVTVHIATPDLDSFRRSESYITGQIARAVARAQRTL